MGLIKSSRELAMQRAAELTGNIDHKSILHEFDRHIKAAQSLASSYLDGKITLDRLCESIGGYPSQAAGAAKAALLKKLNEGLSLNSCRQVLDAFLAFRTEAIDEDAIRSLESMEHEFRDRLADEHASLDYNARLELQTAKGISGSAVAGVNPERSCSWQQAKEALAAELDGALQQIKRQLDQKLSGVAETG